MVHAFDPRRSKTNYGNRSEKSNPTNNHEARLSILRRENYSTVAQWLRTAGSATIAEIAIATGLSKPTVKNRLLDLQARGAAIELAKPLIHPKSSGRPPTRYSFDTNAGFVIGIDMAKHQERVIISNLVGGIVLRDDQPVDPQQPVESRLEFLQRKVAILCEQAKVPEKRILQMGIALPGPISESRKLLHSAVFSDWAGEDVKKLFVERFQTDMVVENDLNAACVAEQLMGAVPGSENFILALLWHQMAAGIMVNGKIQRGAHDLAGELYRLSSSQEITETTRAWKSTPEVLELANLAETGDPEAIKSITNFVHKTAQQLASLLVTLDPELLLMHGALTESKYLVDLVRAKVAEQINPAADVPLKISSHGQDGPLFGVTLLALSIATTNLLGPTVEPVRHLSDATSPQLFQKASQEPSAEIQ